MPILLCVWHIKMAWLKNLIAKVQNPEKRVFMMAELSRILSLNPLGSSNVERDVKLAIHNFYSTFAEEAMFVVYFKENWEGLLRHWCFAFRNFDHNGAHTTSALESYHKNGLKDVMSQSRSRMRGRRLDWLIWFLPKVVLRLYEIKDICKQHGFIQNTKLEALITDALLKSKDIQDVDVAILTTDPAKTYSVKSRTSLEKIYYAHFEHCV